MAVRGGVPATAFHVRLLDGFSVLADGTAVGLSRSEVRLVAFLALHEGSQYRPFVAGNLWPDLDEQSARANLRATLWRLRRRAMGVVDNSGDQLRLSPSVRTDTERLRCLAGSLLNGHSDTPLPATSELGFDLLPGWYEEWVVFERERLRQLCLHALERLAERLLDRAEFGTSLDAALTAVRSEPLRESAHRMAVRVHLAEGNVIEAIRQYETYRDLVATELGVLPSEMFAAMVTDVGRAVAGAVGTTRGPRRATL
jgi:DNA-binding SARP family transcriptional activator